MSQIPTIEDIKEIACDFLWENKDVFRFGYSSVRKRFDEWLLENKYHQNKLQSDETLRKQACGGWKEEYDSAVNEIGQLQEQLKEAEYEIRSLQSELNSR
jgi:hypothetical protein